MERRRTEYVVVYRIRKRPELVRDDNPSPYLAGTTITREELLNDGGVIVKVQNDGEAKNLFRTWRTGILNRLEPNGDLLVGVPKLLKRQIVEVELT